MPTCSSTIVDAPPVTLTDSRFATIVAVCVTFPPDAIRTVPVVVSASLTSNPAAVISPISPDVVVTPVMVIPNPPAAVTVPKLKLFASRNVIFPPASARAANVATSFAAAHRSISPVVDRTPSAEASSTPVAVCVTLPVACTRSVAPVVTVPSNAIAPAEFVSSTSLASVVIVPNVTFPPPD